MITERTTKEEIRTYETSEIKQTFMDLYNQPLRSGPIKDTIMCMCMIELCRREGKNPRPIIEKMFGTIVFPWMEDWMDF